MDIKINHFNLLERITDRLDPLLGRYWSFMSISIDGEVFFQQNSLPAHMVMEHDEQFRAGVQQFLINGIMEQLDSAQQGAFAELLGY